MILLFQSDFGLFVGHLHPLVVHLPIGFLILAFVFFFFGKRARFSYLHKALPFTLGLSAFSSIVAVVFGLLLSNAGGYDESTLFWHKWLGIGVAVITCLAWFWSTQLRGRSKAIPSWLMLGMLVLLTTAGHFGGSLTHGKGYLFNYAPTFLQKIAGVQPDQQVLYGNYPVDPDSIFIYQHLIQKTVEQKCFSCHNDEVQRGNLNMATRVELLKGGDSGPVLVKDSPLESELFHRVTMNPQSRKFMPPKGIPMTYQEVRLLEYWIKEGLSFELPITDKQIPSDIKVIIEEHYQASTKKIPYVEQVTVDAAEEEMVQEVQTAGFKIQRLAANTNFMEASYVGELTKEKLQKLLAVQEQVTHLNLSDTDLKDDWMPLVGKFSNLTKLRLEKNDIGDQGIAPLKELSHLETVNLYGTKVTDQGLSVFKDMPNLQRIYLWQSSVTKDGVSDLTANRPNLLVDIGTID